MKFKDYLDYCHKLDIRNNELKDKLGDKRFFKQARDNIKKHNIELIKSSFDSFKKDIRNYPSSVKSVSKFQQGLIKEFNSNKNDLPIFEIEDDCIEYKIRFPIIPYRKFYIASNICERIDDELYGIGGFFVRELDKDSLLVTFIWSRLLNDGWKISGGIINKEGLLKSESDINHEFIELGTLDTDIKLEEKILDMAFGKFHSLMKKLIYKINKKEYSKYKKHSHGVYIEKSISYCGDVRSHKRHFWKDSGKFIIPTLPRDEILSRGYEIDELVLKDGELRKDVPFKIISEFKIGSIGKIKNKTYDLIEKRHWRCEEKVFSILRELYPDKIIRRHDRRTLKGLELDFNLPELRLGIEYDGEQHFDRKLCEEVFKSDFDAQVRRDRKKDKLCRKKNITLVRIKYDEPLTKTYIKKKLATFHL